MDFGTVLGRFGPKFWLILGPVLGSIWPTFWAKNGPPSGGRFERKHKEFKGFWSFSAPKKGSVLGPFWGPNLAQFWLHFWSHFGPFAGALLGRPEPPICLVFGPAWPAPEAKKKEVLFSINRIWPILAEGQKTRSEEKI